MSQLNWADWVLLAIMLLSAAFGVKRGFVREVLSVVVWVAACVISYTFGDKLASLLTSWSGDTSVRISIAMVLLFAMTLVVGAMLNHVLSEVVSKTGLTGTDRLFGMFFGLARGVIMAIALLVFLPDGVARNDWWKQSMLIPRLMAIEKWSHNMVQGISGAIHAIGEKT